MSCRSFDRAVEEWRQFHCDMNDLSQWLSDTERLMSESVGPDGQLDLDSAKQHQEVSGRCQSSCCHLHLSDSRCESTVGDASNTDYLNRDLCASLCFYELKTRIMPTYYTRVTYVRLDC